jgi:hypothetical protein
VSEGEILGILVWGKRLERNEKAQKGDAVNHKKKNNKNNKKRGGGEF